VSEVGYDHWYTAAIATNGLTYIVKCEDDLVVKHYDTFSRGANFTIIKSENEIQFIADHWINPGSGKSVVVGKRQ